MDERRQEKSARRVASFFQMPLHYPKYSRQDYMAMPEWKLDGLLTEYGLSTSGGLNSKRELAMGTFLWPDPPESQTEEAATPCFLATISNSFIISKKTQ